MPAATPFPADKLVDRLAHNADFPSLGVAVSRVAALALSDTSTVGELANLILSDVHLTQKVLRLANSVHFRGTAPSITTVSKAIARIGSEQVRLVALSALLLERMPNREKAAALGLELTRALHASMLAHVVGPRVGVDAEEAAVCAMFRSIGRLMLAVYAGDCVDAIAAIERAERVDEAEAARRVTGTTLADIGQRILSAWGLPETIVKTLAACPPCAELPAARIDRLRVVSQFVANVAGAVRRDGPRDRAAALQAALAGHGKALDLDADALHALLRTTAERTRMFAVVLEIEDPEATAGPDEEEEATGMSALGIELPPPAAAAATTPATRSPEGKPSDSHALLLAGIQDMTTGFAEGSDIASVLNIATETLHRSMGYRRTLICLRDLQGGFRARIPFGDMPRARLQQFAFGGAHGTDLFWSVMLRNVDVHIRDLADPVIQARLPDWYRAACPDARSFVLLPIVFRERPLGFFYGDRAMVDAAGLTAEELALARMLKSQTLIALRSASEAAPHRGHGHGGRQAAA